MENLSCSVANCAYNSNSLCTANKIQVYSSGDGITSSSAGTSCKTFKPKAYNRQGTQFE